MRARSVLDDEKVRAIKAELRDGAKQQALAKTYDVDQSLISLIWRGKRWAHVE